MPIQYSLAQTPRGRTVARSFSRGEVTLEDVHAALRDLAPGGRFHGLPVMRVIDGSATYTPEGRRLLATVQDATGPLAVVAPSIAIRTMLRFVITTTELRAMALGGPRATPCEFFRTEVEALAWIDTQL
jgi:hypothetical protein